MADTLNTTFVHSIFSQKYVSLISIRATSYRIDEGVIKSLAFKSKPLNKRILD